MMARNQRKREMARMWRQLPSWAWKLALYKADLNRAPQEPYSADAGLSYVEGIDEANLITSESGRIEWTGKHRPVLDIDFPAALIPSTTEGHFHLFLDKELEWETYRKLLKALAEAGIIEQGYADAAIANKKTAVRLPWIRKVRHDYEKPIGPKNQVQPVPQERIDFLVEPDTSVWELARDANRRFSQQFSVVDDVPAPSYHHVVEPERTRGVQEMQAYFGRLEYERRHGLLPYRFRLVTDEYPDDRFQSPYLLRHNNSVYLATPWSQVGTRPYSYTTRDVGLDEVVYEGTRTVLRVLIPTGIRVGSVLPQVVNADTSSRFTGTGIEVTFQPVPEVLSRDGMAAVRTRGPDMIVTSYNSLY